MNLLNLNSGDSSDVISKLGLLASAFSRDPSLFGNMLNLRQSMQDRDAIQRKAQVQEANAQSYLNSIGPDGKPAVGTPQYTQRTFTPDPTDQISDQVFGGAQTAADSGPMTIGQNAPATPLVDPRTQEGYLQKAMGPVNYLNMKIAQSQPKYENVADVGLVQVNAPGGPKVMVGASPKLSDFAKDLEASGIMRGTQAFKDAMTAHQAKQDYIPDMDPLNRAAKEAGMWVESKDAFGNPIIVNKLTGATKTPSGAQGVGADDVDATANMIANYKKKPPTGNAGRSPFWISVMDKVQQINPDYNEQFYNSSNAARTKFSSGKEGTLVRSANVAVSHLETLKALGDALNNGDMNAANAARNKLSEQFGGIPIAGYEAAAPLVGDEVAKFVLGGNSAVSDREKFAAPLSSARSGGQRQAAINSFQGLLVGQLHGLRRQYESETKSKDFADKLDPEVAALLNNPQFAPGNNPNIVPAGASTSAPAAAKALPPGMVRQVGTYQGKPVYIDAQGQRHVVTN